MSRRRLLTGENNCWHTPWEGTNVPDFPHWIMAEFKTPQRIEALVYIPRSATGYQFVTKYEVWISPDANEDHLQKVTEGEWTRGASGVAQFPVQEAKLVKFVILEKADANQNPDDPSVSASEIRFRLDKNLPGAYDDDILKTVGRAENVLAYAQDLLGDAEHQMDRSLYDALAADVKDLEALVGTGGAQVIQEQISRVEDGIIALLGSNKTEEESLFMDIPRSMMAVSANSSNAGYLPERAIDGNPGTIGIPNGRRKTILSPISLPLTCIKRCS